MIKMMSLINETFNRKYMFGCMMIYFDFPEMKYIHNLIDPSHLYIDENDNSYGLETEPHTTLLFGFHEEVTPEQVKSIVDKHQFGPLVARNVSLFQNPLYEVLKFDIGYPTRGGAFLHKCNEELKTLPYTSSFPNYHPHMTIGYVKPGLGSKYIRKFDHLNYNLVPQYGIYSHPDGSKTKMSLNLI